MQDNMEIYRCPKLLQKLTTTEYECLSYPEQIQRLKQLRKLPEVKRVLLTADDIPF